MTKPKELRMHALSDADWNSQSGKRNMLLIVSAALSAITILLYTKIHYMAILAGIAEMAVIFFMLPDITQAALGARRGVKPEIKTVPYAAVTLIYEFAAYSVLLIPIFTRTSLWWVAAAVSCFISLVYSQARMLCADGYGPVESLRKSRRIMQGNKLRYLKTILPVMCLRLLAAAGPLATVGITAYSDIKEYDIRIIFPVIVLSACMMMFLCTPVNVYADMVKAEFYDDLMGMPMNPVGDVSVRHQVSFSVATIVIYIAGYLIIKSIL